MKARLTRLRCCRQSIPCSDDCGARTRCRRDGFIVYSTQESKASLCQSVAFKDMLAKQNSALMVCFCSRGCPVLETLRVRQLKKKLASKPCSLNSFATATYRNLPLQIMMDMNSVETLKSGPKNASELFI